MGKGIVECIKCGEKEFYEGDNPNDIIAQTGFQQTESGVWLCPECLKDRDATEGC